jgi:cyclopropane fatty-acyl-phospholipid synthase-like methyltransferase
MTVDYKILADKYDLTRTADINIINLFAEEISLENKIILDFGCGTGNLCQYTGQDKKKSSSQKKKYEYCNSR